MLDVGASLAACCRTDREDGLFATVVDELGGAPLGVRAVPPPRTRARRAPPAPWVRRPCGRGACAPSPPARTAARVPPSIRSPARACALHRRRHARAHLS
eukprot:4631109-Prymnesium_polylepis.1